MAGAAKATIDHDFIQRWVEERGGRPVVVPTRRTDRPGPGILRIDMPGYADGDKLKPISWDEWFELFDENGLAFLYQDTIRGRRGNSRKLVSRETATIGANGRAGGRAGTAPRKAQRGKTTGREAAGGKATRGKAAGARAARGKKTRGRAAGGKAVGGKAAGAPTRGKAARGKQVRGEAMRGQMPAAEQDAIQMITEQHRHVEALLDRIETGSGKRVRERAFVELADALAVHAALEERLLYPTLAKGRERLFVLHGAEEHLGVKRILADLLELDVSDETFMAKIRALRELVEMHVEEEEEHLLPMARELLERDQLQAMAREMTALAADLQMGEPRRDVPDEIEAAPPL